MTASSEASIPAHCNMRGRTNKTISGGLVVGENGVFLDGGHGSRVARQGKGREKDKRIRGKTTKRTRHSRNLLKPGGSWVQAILGATVKLLFPFVVCLLFYQPLKILVLGFGTILLVFNREQQDRRRGGTRNNHDEVKRGTTNNLDEVKRGTTNNHDKVKRGTTNNLNEVKRGTRNNLDEVKKTRNNHDEVKGGTRNNHDEVKGGTRMKTDERASFLSGARQTWQATALERGR